MREESNTDQHFSNNTESRGRSLSRSDFHSRVRARDSECQVTRTWPLHTLDYSTYLTLIILRLLIRLKHAEK